MRHRVLNCCKQGLALLLSSAMVITGMGAPPPAEVEAAVLYSDVQVFQVWMKASGIKTEGSISEEDYAKLYSNLTTSDDFRRDTSLKDKLDNTIADAGLTGMLEVSDTSLRTGIREWVKELYKSSKASLPASLGLKGKYSYTEEYTGVSKYYADSYDFITETNEYNASFDGHERITGAQTLNLGAPKWYGVNLTSGTLATDKTVSISKAFKLFEYDQDFAFSAHPKTIQKNEADGYFESTPATVTEHPSSHFPGTMHVHTGNSLTGSGCYTKPVYHQHEEDCYEESYAMVASAQVSVFRTVSGNGYQLDFTSDSASFPFLRVFTSTSGSHKNYYKTYQGNKVEVTGNVTNVFTGDDVLDTFKNIASRCIQVGTSTTYKWDITWSEMYKEFSALLSQCGYTATLCPAYSSSYLATCGMTEGETVISYALGCGLEQGKYYDNSLHEVHDIGPTVVTSAKLLHPIQTIMTGDNIDTRVVLGFLDGHTEVVNAIKSQKLAYIAIESTQDPNVSKIGTVYPYSITVAAKFGQTAIEATLAGVTTQTFIVLVEEVGAHNSSSEESKAEEEFGRNDVVIEDDEHVHTDACYPGEKHKHTAECRTNVTYHTHTVADCGYTWKGNTDDLKVYMTEVGSSITVVYCSQLNMYKIGFDINKETGYIGFGEDNNISNPLSFTKWDSSYQLLTGQNLENTWNLFHSVFDELAEADSESVEVNYHTFVDRIFANHDNMTDIIPLLTDSCQNKVFKKLDDVPHEWACGKEDGVSIDSCDYICGKEEGKYYNGSMEVDPQCDKVISEVQVVYPVQTVQCNQPISTLSRVIYLDGHVVLANKKGSNPQLVVTTDYEMDDYTHAGEPWEYHISVTGYFTAYEAWDSEPSTQDYDVEVTMLAASKYTADMKKQVIMQGDNPDYSGTVVIGDDTITDEQYRENLAVFTNDIQPDWVGEHTVTMTASLGNASVSDTVTVWIVPLPTNLSIKCTKDEVEQGEEPEFNVSVEYGESESPAFVRSTGTFSWSELHDGVSISNAVTKYGIRKEFSETVSMGAITNLGASDGETGADYRTAGKYSVAFASTGTTDMSADVSVSVWTMCPVNEKHGKYYADSCPVCDYRDLKGNEFRDGISGLNTLLNAVTELLDFLDTDYNTDGYVKGEDGKYNGVSERYTESFEETLNDYKEQYSSLSDLKKELEDEKKELEDNYALADSADDIDSLLDSVKQYLDQDYCDELIGSANGFSDNAIRDYEKMQTLLDGSSLIRGQRIRLQLNGMDGGTVGDTDGAGDTVSYAFTYDGNSCDISPTFSPEDPDELPEQELDYIANNLRYKVQIQGEDGEWSDFTGMVRRAGTYTLKYVSLDPDYTEINNPYITITIEKKTLSYSVTLQDKEYDGTNTGIASFGRLEGIVTDDDVSIAKTKAVYAQSGVGEGISISFENPVTLEGDDANNYLLEQPTGLKGNIVAKDLSLKFGEITKVYDGSDTVTVKPKPLQGIIGNDVVAIADANITLTFPSKNVVSGAALQYDLPELSGSDARNYRLVKGDGAVGSITAKQVSVFISVQDKVYDGTTDATLVVNSEADFIAGDEVILPETASGTFTTKDVGEDIGLDSYDSVVATGVDTINYSFSYEGLDLLTASITPREVTYTVTVQDKVYNQGTEGFAEISKVDGILDKGVSLAKMQIPIVFADSNAGDGISVTLPEPITLVGEGADNYQIEQPTGLEGSITPFQLTAKLEGINKVYDGTDKAYVKVSELQGWYDGDDVYLASDVTEARFETSNSGPKVKITDISKPVLQGEQAENYVVDVDVELYAAINGTGIAVQCEAIDREYDGTNKVVVKVLGVDTELDIRPAVTEVEGTIESPDAGNNILVSVGDIEFTGADAAGYSAEVREPVLVTIYPKKLDYGITAIDHVYDGSTDAQIYVKDLSGIVGEDDISFSETIVHGSLAAKDVGETEFTPESEVTLMGEDAHNYCIDQPESGITVTVVKRPIFVRAQNLDGIAYCKYTDEELQLLVKVTYSEIIPDDREAVLASLVPPTLKKMSSKRIGTFNIEFEEGTGDATYNYEFNFQFNEGKYTVVKEEGTIIIDIDTGKPDTIFDIDVDDVHFEVISDSDGVIHIPVAEGVESKVIVDEQTDSDDDGDGYHKEFIAGPDGSIYEIITKPGDGQIGEDENGVYWVDEDGNKHYTNEITIGKDENGNYWEDSDGNKHYTDSDVIGKDEDGAYWKDEDGNKHYIDNITIGNDTDGSYWIDGDGNKHYTDKVVTGSDDNGNYFEYPDGNKHYTGDVTIGSDNDGIYWEDEDGNKYRPGKDPIGKDDDGIYWTDNAGNKHHQDEIAIGKDDNGSYWTDENGDRHYPDDGSIGSDDNGMYWTDEDGNKNYVDEVTVGTDEKGDYWKDSNGEKHYFGDADSGTDENGNYWTDTNGNTHHSGDVILGSGKDGIYFEDFDGNKYRPDDITMEIDENGNNYFENEDGDRCYTGDVTIGSDELSDYWTDSEGGKHYVGEITIGKDEDGYFVLDENGDRHRQDDVTIGSDENGSYWEDFDSNKHYAGNVPIGSDDKGIYWEDSDGNKHYPGEIILGVDDNGGYYVGPDGEKHHTGGVTTGKDENGNYFVDSDGNKHPTGDVTIGADDKGSYWEDEDGNKHYIGNVTIGKDDNGYYILDEGGNKHYQDNITIGKDENGSYWIDEDGNEHRTGDTEIGADNDGIYWVDSDGNKHYPSEIFFGSDDDGSYWMGPNGLKHHSGEILLGSDNKGDYWMGSDGTKHHSGSGGFVFNNDNCPKKITIFEAFDGTIILDGINVETNGPFIDIIDGSPTIDLKNNNSIVAPDGSAGIRVDKISSLTIIGSGMLAVTHTEEDSGSVGIGGNDGESSGTIIIDGGVLLGAPIGTIGSTESSKVVIVSGAVDAPVESDDVKDTDGNPLRYIVVNAATAVNKRNVTTTKVDRQDSNYFKVYVNRSECFRQWIPEEEQRIWCYSDERLYYVNSNDTEPIMIEVKSFPDDPEKPENPDDGGNSGNPENPDNGGNSGNSSGNGGSGSGSGGGWNSGSGSGGSWNGGSSSSSGSGTGSGDSSNGSGNGSDDSGNGSENGSGSDSGNGSDSSYFETLDNVDKDSLKIPEKDRETLDFLKDHLVYGSGEEIQIIDDIVYITNKDLKFDDSTKLSFDNKTFSSSVKFPADGVYFVTIYIKDLTNEGLKVLKNFPIIVDSTAPTIKLKTNTPKVWILDKRNPNLRQFSQKTVRLRLQTTDALSGIDNIEYKVVQKGQKASKVKWKSYTAGQLIQMYKTQQYKVYWKVTDKAGNTTNCRTNLFYVDKSRPKVKVHKHKKFFTVYASDFSGVKYIRLNGKKVKNGNRISKTGRYNIVVQDRSGRKTKKTILFIRR